MPAQGHGDRAGITGTRLDELVEHMLRIVRSFVIDPGRPPRSGSTLRNYLTTWIAPLSSAPRPTPLG